MSEGSSIRSAGGSNPELREMCPTDSFHVNAGALSAQRRVLDRVNLCLTLHFGNSSRTMT